MISALQPKFKLGFALLCLIYSISSCKKDIYEPKTTETSKVGLKKVEDVSYQQMQALLNYKQLGTLAKYLPETPLKDKKVTVAENTEKDIEVLTDNIKNLQLMEGLVLQYL